MYTTRLNQTLSSVQNATADSLLGMIRRSNVALLKAGQRSGKSIVANAVAEKGGYNLVYVFGQAQAPLTHLFSMHAISCGIRVPRTLVENQNPKALIVIDECMWIKDSYDLYNEVRVYAQVLCVSSRGPEYDNDMRWKMHPGLSFSTWDLNPNLTFGHLAQERNFNEYHSLRDFCAF